MTLILGIFALGMVQVAGAQGRCPYAGGSSVESEMPDGYQRAIHVVEQTAAPRVIARPVSLVSTHGQLSQAPAVRVAEHLLTDQRFGHLVSLLRATGLHWPENSAAGITVLAPTDSALAGLSDQRLTELATDPVALRRFLDRHSISGALSRAALAKRASVLSLGHRTLHIEAGAHLTVNRAELGHAPLIVADGVIHPVDRPISD
jgi:uncharacterized surface protein with fasciclin (FAS1) repeats